MAVGGNVGEMSSERSVSPSRAVGGRRRGREEGREAGKGWAEFQRVGNQEGG